MKNILIHCAMEKEGTKIVKELGLTYKEDNIYRSIIKNTEVTLIITGIGKQKTAIKLTKYLENYPKPELIINIGFVGSTDVEIGKWISVNKVYNLEWNIPDKEKYSMDIGNQELEVIRELEKIPCYSAECFVTKTDIKERVVFDMELHSICLIADIYKVPLVSIKQVSDNLSIDKYYENIGRINLEDGVKYIKKYIS